MPPKQETKAHASLGASNCERWWNCPGSVNLIESLGLESRTSIYAAEGTVAHSVAADLLLKYLGRQKYALNCVPGVSKRKADGFEILVTEEMLDAVQIYVDYVGSLIELHDCRFDNALVEQRIHIPHKESDLFGTSDLLLRVPFKILIVVDYKHGAGQPVEPEGNKQLLYYALGALYSLPEDDRHNYPTIEMVIVQPRTPGDAIQKWEVPVETVWEFGEELAERATACSSPEADLSAGEWCKYCPAKSVCPAIRERIQSEAGLDFAQLPATIGAISLPKVENYSDEQLAQILDHKSLIEDLLDALHKEAYSRAERGHTIPGYHLVEKWGHRKWNPDQLQEAKEDFEAWLGQEAYEKKLKSPAQMEKSLKAAGVKKNVDFYTTKESLGKALAPISDKRKPAAPRAIDDFKDWSMG